MQLELTVGHAQQNPGTREDVDIDECVGIAFMALDGNEVGGCFWEVECQEADDGGAGQEQEGPPRAKGMAKAVGGGGSGVH